MQQFIPFEDDWDALKNLRPEDFVPYRVGLAGKSILKTQRQVHLQNAEMHAPPSQMHDAAL